MTVNWTVLTSGFSEVDGTIFTTAAIDPVDAQDCLIALLSDDTAGGLEAPTSVVGNGITWTLAQDIPYSTIAAPTRRLFVYKGKNATPSIGTVVVTFPQTQNGLRWIILQAEGTHATTPFPQNAEITPAADAASLTVEAAFGSAFAGASSGVIAFLARNTSTSPTPEAGWTQIGTTVASVTPNASLAAFWIAANDTNPSPATWTGSARTALIALEVQPSSTLTATQKQTYIRSLEKLQAKAGRILGRLVGRRHAGADTLTLVDAVRAIMTSLEAKWDELLTDATDIVDPTTALDADLDTVLAAIGAAGDNAPQPVPLVKGLMLRTTTPPSGAIIAYNPNISWASLQSTKGGAIGGAGKTSIDNKIAAQSGTPWRMRLFCGWDVPQFVLDEVGSVTIESAQHTGPDQEVARWFDPAFSPLYDDLIQKLADLYDGQLSLIFASSAMVYYAEPCLKQTASLLNRQNLVAAGYKFEDDVQTFYDGFDSLTAFTQTRVGCAYNDYQYIDSAGKQASDRATRNSLIDYHREKFGERAVLQNNSLRPSFVNSEIYPYIQSKGAPFSFQTGSSAQLYPGGTSQQIHDALIDMLDFAVALGANAVEVPNDQNLTTQEKIDYQAALAANA